MSPPLSLPLPQALALKMYGIASDPSDFYLVEILEGEERVVMGNKSIFELQEGKNPIKLCIRQKVCSPWLCI